MPATEQCQMAKLECQIKLETPMTKRSNLAVSGFGFELAFGFWCLGLSSTWCLASEILE
jgi:hypothetical protein